MFEASCDGHHSFLVDFGFGYIEVSQLREVARDELGRLVRNPGLLQVQLLEGRFTLDQRLDRVVIEDYVQACISR